MSETASAPEEAAPTPGLKRLGTVRYEPGAGFDPMSVYTSGTISKNEEFRGLILNRISFDAVGPFGVTVDELPENMTDVEVRRLLQNPPLFDDAQACALIAYLASRQPQGEEGDLRHDKSANLFFIKNRTLRLRYHSTSIPWDITTWVRGLCWDKGSRVFSLVV